MVGGSGGAHEVVNGGEMVPGWGDQPTGEWSALGALSESLSREAGSARARPGRGFERVSGTAHEAVGEGGWARFGVAVEVAVHQGRAGGHNTICYHLSASTGKHELPLTLQPLNRRVSVGRPNPPQPYPGLGVPEAAIV